MTKALDLYQWISAHPQAAALWAIVILSACLIVAMAIMVVHAIWRDWEEEKAERALQSRRELDAVMALTHDLNKRGPTGFHQPSPYSVAEARRWAESQVQTGRRHGRDGGTAA